MTRPQGIPEDATLIPPGQSFGPGVGVQAATLRAIMAQNDHLNANADLRYEHALADWTYNAQWAEAAHQRVPPRPPYPLRIVTHIVYATPAGVVVPEAGAGADGLHCAWIYEMYE